MGFVIAKFVSLWLLPPAFFILLLGFAVFYFHKRPTRAKKLVIVTLALIGLTSLPIVSGGLLTLVETYPALSAEQVKSTNAQAIVILSAGWETAAPEYGGDTVDKLTLERLRYGVYLHRKTGLPILVTGGSPLIEHTPLGELMAHSLEQDFGLSAAWVETKSRNTAENANFSADILRKENLSRVLLVTHAWHMRRSVPVFESAGLTVTAAPTVFEGFHGEGLEITDFLPNMTSLHESYYALHEMIGYLWYAVRY